MPSSTTLRCVVFAAKYCDMPNDEVPIVNVDTFAYAGSLFA